MMTFLLGLFAGGAIAGFSTLLAMTARAAERDEELARRVEAMRQLVHRYDEDDCA